MRPWLDTTSATQARMAATSEMSSSAKLARKPSAHSCARGLGAGRDVDVSKHNVRAVLGDAACARPSNAASGTRNECHLTDQRASGLSHQRLYNPIGAGCRDCALVP